MFAVFAFKVKISIILKMIEMKQSVNEAKLTGLCARDCATIQQDPHGFDFKICLRTRRSCRVITINVPWVPEVFLACGENFRCWPKADTSSAVGRSHELWWFCLYDPYMMIMMMTDNSWKYSFFTCKVDGGYSPWSEFGPCSKSCGTGGLQKRYRTCSNPAPMNGGKPCFGHPYQTRVCSVIPCPGNKSNIK